MLEIIVKLVLAYLIGSVNGSLLLGRFRGVDIRTEGSGNAGGTNALRTHGVLFALGVIIVDVGKAVIAVLWIPGLALGGMGVASAAPDEWLKIACGAAAVIGHCWPVFYGFRGGKGMATLVGTYAVLAPAVFVAVVVAWLVFLVLFGYVGVATILGAAAAPVYIAVTGYAPVSALFLFGLAMACLILFTHRSNISRIRSGHEKPDFHALMTRLRKS
ncbi:MAG: glycerol-3-phosphate acyltransferase [Gammaproteobacteria bacterium]